MFRNRLTRGPLGLVALSAAVLAMVTACSGGGAGGPASASGDLGAVSAAKKALAPHVDPAALDWPKPTEHFAPGAHKLAILIPGPGGASISQGDAAKEAAEAMGWQATIFNGEFNPSKQAGYIEQAVQSGYDAIFISVVDPSSIKSAIQYAQSKGVPIACASCVDGSSVPNDGIIHVTVSMKDAGTAIGDYMVANSNGGATVVGFTDKAFVPVVARVSAAGAEVKRVCPKCTYKEVDFPTADLSKPGPPTWTAFLASHPKGTVDWVATGYEAMAVPFTKTLTQLSRNDIKITSFDNNLPDTNQLIAAGNTAYKGTTAFPYTYEAWAGVDLVARAINHKTAWNASKLPYLVVDKSNVAYFKGKPDLIPATFDYKSMFESLWK